jgi:hypothetical protein
MRSPGERGKAIPGKADKTENKRLKRIMSNDVFIPLNAPLLLRLFSPLNPPILGDFESSIDGDLSPILGDFELFIRSDLPPKLGGRGGKMRFRRRWAYPVVLKKETGEIHLGLFKNITRSPYRKEGKTNNMR